MTKGTPQITFLPKDLADQMISTKVWQDDCPVGLKRLSLISSIPYIDFAGNEHNDGELVVLDVAASYVLSAFQQLHKRKFPIRGMRSLHHYQANDELSMADNNTSCFCHRPIEGTHIMSLHSYGLAIDINPVQNPYVIFGVGNESNPSIHPKASWEYLNRHNQKPGMVEEIVSIMAQHGFYVWGGRWTTPIDFHHFQPPRGIAELLVVMNRQDANRLFKLSIEHQESLKKLTLLHGRQLEPLIELYKQEPEQFFTAFVDTIN